MNNYNDNGMDLFTKYGNSTMDLTNVEVNEYKAMPIGTHIVKCSDLEIIESPKLQFVFTFKNENGEQIKEFAPLNPQEKTAFKTARILDAYVIPRSCTPLNIKQYVLDPNNKVEITVEINKFKGTNNEGLLVEKEKTQIKSIKSVSVQQPNNNYSQPQQGQQQSDPFAQQPQNAPFDENNLPF